MLILLSYKLASKQQLSKQTVKSMMLEIAIGETEITLNQLLSQVEQGEEVTITRQGKPVARLLPIQQNSRPLSSRIELRASQPLQKESSLETLQNLRHEARY